MGIWLVAPYSGNWRFRDDEEETVLHLWAKIPGHVAGSQEHAPLLKQGPQYIPHLAPDPVDF